MKEDKRVEIKAEEDFIFPSEIQDIIWDSEAYHDYSQEEKDNLLKRIVYSAEEGDGNGHICNQLGAMYAEGRLVEADSKKSYEWYKKSSDLGYALGTCNLGFNYMYGLGTEINYEEAFKCFSEAATFGMTEAIVRLGDMYGYGYYVNKNNNKAYKMYSMAYNYTKDDLTDLASFQVYSDVTIRLGNCFYYGYGVEKNTLKAYHFYSEAYYYYMLRKKMGDSYYHSGLKKSREKVAQILSELED